MCLCVGERGRQRARASERDPGRDTMEREREEEELGCNIIALSV